MYFNTHVEKPFVCPSRCTHVDLISVDVSCGSHFELGASLNFFSTSAAAEVSLCVLGVHLSDILQIRSDAFAEGQT